MSKTKHFHFIGICGTAMGSTALAFRAQGHRITGSDGAVYPPMSTLLESNGVELFSGYKPENLPADADVYIVGNAISRGNPELEELLNRKLCYTSLAEALKWEVIQGKRSFVVSGTHGKTTTTSILAWLFESAGKNPGFMIGGVPENFPVGARFTDSDLFVIEGDEYDTAYFDKRSKFVHYLPECAIVNNIEFDHADIFKDLDEIMLSFTRFINLVPKNGRIFLNGDDANCLRLIEKSPAPISKVGTGEGNDICIRITGMTPESTTFDLNGVSFTLLMIGEFNVRNAAMAVCAARFGGLTDDEIHKGLLAFMGVRRRQQERGEVNGITIIDDFGHHPTALRETLRGMRQRFPGRRLWAVFEPRSNTSRRNVLQYELIEALKEADGSVLAAINAAEKVPPELRLNADAVVMAVCAAGRESYHESSTDSIIGKLKERCRSGDVIVIFSNGGFDGIQGKLLERLK